MSKLITYGGEKRLAKEVMKWVAQFTSKTFSSVLSKTVRKVNNMCSWGTYAYTPYINKMSCKSIEIRDIENYS